MATIIQFPDAISLSGNINDIVLSSAVSVNFKIKEGTETILEEDYDPDENNNINIRLHDIIPTLLSVAIPDSNLFEQTEAAKTFSFLIDDSPTNIKVVLGGVDASVDASTFLQANWLTWQPQQKTVKYTDAEWLSIYAVVNTNVKVKAYFKSNPAEIHTLTSLTAGKFYSLNVMFEYLSGLFSTAQPVYFDIWTENSSFVQMSFTQRYVLTADYYEFDDIFVFQNSLGGIDTVRFSGVKEEDNKFDISSALFDEDTADFDVDYNQVFTKNTGYVASARERAWFNDFFNSIQRYLVTGDGLKGITVSSPDAKIDPQDPSSFFYEFKFALARQTKYLNFARSDSLPTDVEIIDPDTELFFLAPRLIEFPQATIDNSLLFPVQVPFVQEWKVLTYGALKNAILSEIISMNFITGADVSEYISADLGMLSVEDGYIYISGNKAKAGDSDELGGIAAALYYHHGNANRNDTDWTMKDGFVANNIGSESYTEGFAGSGWRIGPLSEVDSSPKAEFDYLSVRKSMTVYELLIAKLRSINGGIITSVANGVVESVDGDDVTLKGDDNSFVVNDRVRMQAWTGTGTRYYEAEVTAVSGQVITLGNYVGTDTPEAEDNLVQWGNTSDTNRQNFLYQTAMDGAYFSVLANVTSSDLSGKETVRLGDLSGITSPVFGALSGYGLRVANNGYFENVKVSGQITVTGGNAETTTGSQSKADSAESAAISAASSDATSKANTAQSTAISTAAADATSKANSAQNAAQSYSDGIVSSLSGSLGALAYESLVSASKLDSTVIEGGYIKTTLINASVLSITASQITDLKIGGRNLIINSSFSDNLDSWSIFSTGGVVEIYEQTLRITSGLSNYCHVAQWVHSIMPSTMYTLSIYTDFISSSGALYLYSIELKSDGSSTIVYKDHSFNITSLGEKSITFTTQPDCDKMVIYVRAQAGPKTIQVHNIKLEQGNPASAWSPAPDDIENFSQDLYDALNTAKQEAIVSGKTLIVGGYLNTDFIEVGTISANKIITTQITSLGAVTAGSFNIGSGKFTVASDGTLSATGASISGAITASSGTIGNLAISSGYLYNNTGTGSIYLSNSGDTKIAAIGSSAIASLYGVNSCAVFINNSSSSSTIYALIAYADNSGSGDEYAALFSGRVTISTGDFYVNSGVIYGARGILSSKTYHMPNSNAALPSGYSDFVGNLKTANRLYTLPLAANYKDGEEIRIMNYNSYDSLIYHQGSNTINGSSTSYIQLADAWQSVCLKSDGSSNWTIVWLVGQFI